MNLVQKALALREGGQVIRAHTMPYVGAYNVAIHSYNAVSLLLLLYPGQPRVELIRAVMWHDVPERWTGDVPSPAKWSSSDLKEVLDNLEQKILDTLGEGELFTNLTFQESYWLTAVDLLELWMWGQDQAAMGNYAANKLMYRVFELIKSKWERIPKEVQDFITEFKWERTGECNELL